MFADGVVLRAKEKDVLELEPEQWQDAEGRSVFSSYLFVLVLFYDAVVSLLLDVDLNIPYPHIVHIDCVVVYNNNLDAYCE